MKTLSYSGPIVLAILDGVGLAPDGPGNAVTQAHTEFLDYALKDYLNIPLEASGEAVGVLKGDMGNSEVGHNAIGSGQIAKQGIAKVEDAFDSREVFNSEAWHEIISNLKASSGKTLHFSGIFSDGNVHSSISHLEKMISEADKEGIEKIRIHLVLDGRDVPPQSEPKYINRLESFLAPFKKSGRDYKIASGAGRMVAVADRYESNWNMVKLGWDMIVHGVAEHKFSSAVEAIKFFREKDPEVQDQYLPPFVVVDESDAPVGRVENGDSFIYFDFRADRAIEIAMAFTYNDFPYFDRSFPGQEISNGNSCPNVCFAGMTEYNSDTHVPHLTMVSPVEIKNTLNVLLGKHNIPQLAISEAVKFGHITYYFNGNSYEKQPGEDHIRLESDTLPFDTRPWMKSAEIADVVLENLEKYKFIRLNFPGGDMVGHFAELEPTISALEAIDISLARIAKKVDELGGMMIITGDHGNAEELLDSSGNPKTSHSTNKVPCIFYDNTKNRDLYSSNPSIKSPGLSNIAASIATLLDLSDIPEEWNPSLLSLKPPTA
ncbi:2,3-bisphosphoglycerate-independent phosphoglycerate mutase [Candidatus Saccharibacteria bacterium]|nr:2,3-bisphosphoglycerate-independent phosphoglycerate mutase [Candidatus Saccharibacteria bacterium]